MPKGLCRLACAGNKVDRCAVAAIACGAWPRCPAGRNLDLSLMQNAAICRRKSLRCNGLRRFWASGCLFNESSQPDGGKRFGRDLIRGDGLGSAWPWRAVALLGLWSASVAFMPICSACGVQRGQRGVPVVRARKNPGRIIPAGVVLRNEKHPRQVLPCRSVSRFVRSESRATARPRSRSAR